MLLYCTNYFSCPLCDVEYIGLEYILYIFFRELKNIVTVLHPFAYIFNKITIPALSRSLDLAKNFAVLKKYQRKIDCLVYEMLLIKKYRPSLNIKSDSIRAKVFT